jgi:hypothetical protein
LAVEKIFNDMIDSVTLKSGEPRAALEQAQNAVNLLLGKK